MQTLANTAVGDYRLLELIGAGGMGEVYRAVHSKIGRIVAVKVLLRGESGLSMAERFINEARIHAGLHHPHIAELYDFVEIQGRPCIIMEYVDGITLHARIEQLHGGVPVPEALRIFRAVVEAIAYLHERGVVHRDIKSSNIKLGATGQVKLLDFGIAKDPASRQLTMVGGCVGTMDYLAPEQIRGKPADARADVWALGVLFYEMLTATLPFAADSVGVLCERIARADYRTPDLASPLSSGLKRVLGRCLRSEPAERYRDARDLLDDLGKIEHSAPTSMRRAETTFSTPWWRTVQTNWPLLGAGLLLIGVLAAAVLWKDSPTVLPAPPGPAKPDQAIPVGSPGVSPGVPLALVRIATIDGPAEVYENGRQIGTTANLLEREYPVGAHVVLTLKREGYEDLRVEIDVGESGHESHWQLWPKGSR